MNRIGYCVYESVHSVMSLTCIQSVFGIWRILLPPSINSLTERLNERGTNSKESIELRLSNAMREIPSCKNYDHILVNDVFEDCCNDLASIITGEDSFPMNSKKELFLTKLLNS